MTPAENPITNDSIAIAKLSEKIEGVRESMQSVLTELRTLGEDIKRLRTESMTTHGEMSQKIVLLEMRCTQLEALAKDEKLETESRLVALEKYLPWAKAFVWAALIIGALLITNLMMGKMSIVLN